jgi:hypothetical protein
MRSAAIPWIAALAVASTAIAGEAGLYSFVVDGTREPPLILSLNATPGGPQPGDVAGVGDLWLVLGQPGEYRFETTPEDDGRLLRITPEGRRQVVAVTVDVDYGADDEAFIDPLAHLKPQEIRGLMGVRLLAWPKGTGERLEHIDPARCCIALSGDTAQGKVRRLPRLPQGLRYLCIGEDSTRAIRDLSPLRRQRELR